MSISRTATAMPIPGGIRVPVRNPGCSRWRRIPFLLVERSQTVHILIISDSLLEGEVFRVGGGIGNRRRPERPYIPPANPISAVSWGKAVPERTMMGRRTDSRNLTHRLEAVIDDRASVQHRTARPAALFDSLLGFLKFQIAGVGVGGVGQKVRPALILKTLKQGDVVFHQGDSAARLDQGPSLLFCLDDFPGVVFFRGKSCEDTRPPRRDQFPEPVGHRERTFSRSRKNSSSDQRLLFSSISKSFYRRERRDAEKINLSGGICLSFRLQPAVFHGTVQLLLKHPLIFGLYFSAFSVLSAVKISSIFSNIFWQSGGRFPGSVPPEAPRQKGSIGHRCKDWDSWGARKTALPARKASSVRFLLPRG